MILPKNNNNQGVFLELLVTAKSATIRYPAGYQYDIRPDTSMISGRIPDNWITNRIPDSEKGPDNRIATGYPVHP